MKRLQTDALWTEIDGYLEASLVPGDDALEAALAAAKAAGLPPIHVAANQGKLLMLLARAMGAKRILEIGTLAGYSTIWLARGLVPGGKLVTLDANPKCVEVARANIARAGLAETVEFRLGKAADSLPSLAAEPPFDLIFIDADKEGTPGYFQWSVKLAREGALIVVDNVVREGAILDNSGEDSSVQGMRRFFELAATDPRVTGRRCRPSAPRAMTGWPFCSSLRDDGANSLSPCCSCPSAPLDRREWYRVVPARQRRA